MYLNVTLAVTLSNINEVCLKLQVVSIDKICKLQSKSRKENLQLGF